MRLRAAPRHDWYELICLSKFYCLPPSFVGRLGVIVLARQRRPDLSESHMSPPRDFTACTILRLTALLTPRSTTMFR